MQLNRLLVRVVGRYVTPPPALVTQSAARLSVRAGVDVGVELPACLYAARICHPKGSRTVVPPRGAHEGMWALHGDLRNPQALRNGVIDPDGRARRAGGALPLLQPQEQAVPGCPVVGAGLLDLPDRVGHLALLTRRAPT